MHQVYLDTYHIGKTPVTNAQYQFFVAATGLAAPSHWQKGTVPQELAHHPVVNVSWHDALAYCRWLSEVTGKNISLPSEAEWEKAARGDKDKREYPWGDAFDPKRANTGKGGPGKTTAVGSYPQGASPYEVLDMSGNVWQWTRSLYKPYPYLPDDGRENLEDTSSRRVLRGGSFSADATSRARPTVTSMFPAFVASLAVSGWWWCVVRAPVMGFYHSEAETSLPAEMGVAQRLTWRRKTKGTEA